MKKNILCKVVFISVFIGSFNVNSQATFISGANATQLATQLSNTGFTITNPVITNGVSIQSGTFANGIAGVGLELDEGVVLTTANMSNILNTDSWFESSFGAQGYVPYFDPDLVAINTEGIYDVFVYEFDFIISGTSPKIFALDYQFASEEYPNYVCSEFNDIFGFFVSGGDLVSTSNLASVRGKNVAVNSINSGTMGVNGDDIGLCDFENSDLFIDNESGFSPGPISIIFNGLTKTLRAYTILRPGISYHMKMTIADSSDNQLDSGIFIAPIQIFDLPAKADVDFDGVDDYIDSLPFMAELDASTLSAWVKLDDTFSSAGDICGQSNFKLFVDAAGKLKTSVRTGTPSVISLEIPDASAPVLEKDLWYQATTIFDGANGTLTLYLNGEEVWEGTGLSSELDDDVTNFAVGRNSDSNDTYFNGSIDEVKVYDVALSNNQIKEQVYQEIENVGGLVYGSTIPKPIDDGSLSWNTLLLYYNMNLIYDIILIDISPTVKNGIVNNITTIQAQTAPLPYVANNTGDWTTESTWKYGNVWDIDDLPEKAWAIVKVTDNTVLSTNVSHDLKGLIINSGSELKVQNNQLLKNTNYLELNGTLDLEDDSQLIQTVNSDLVTAATGKTLRRQEGASNVYRYNYWSSPVGVTAVSSLTDNNASTNNTNNTPFNLNMIKDEAGINLSFTSAYDEVGKISTYWLYTFKNGVTYWDWANFSPSAPLEAGVGYTQKGTGNAGVEQQYIFEGKPNNGTILINVTDVGGPGSVTSVSKTEYLLGNPYPSSLDIHKFIDDNIGVIDGTLQLWQQWAGDSHYLNEYKGGYAQVNKLGSVRAYQFVGIESANNGSQDGTVTPSRYLPVGQGFITEIVADGNIEFNNSQRIFIKESDADGTYNNGASFFKSSDAKSKKSSSTSHAKANNEGGSMQKIRLEFNSTSGPATRRELLLGFSETTTDGYDYGYDAECDESTNNDFNLGLDDKNMNMQAYSPIAVDKVIPLNFRSSGDHSFEIRMTETENLDEDQEIYLKDHLTGGYFELTTMDVYSFSSEQGKFNSRFEIVFQNEAKSLSTGETTFSKNYIYYQNKTNTLFVKKLNNKVKKLTLINMRGQTVLEVENMSTESLENGFKFSDISAGVYVVFLRTEMNEVLTKKIVFN